MLVRTPEPSPAFSPFLALPLICAQPFETGFLAFCSAVLSCCSSSCFGFATRSNSPSRLLVVAALFLLLYFSHPVPYVLAGVTVACLIAKGGAPAFQCSAPGGLVLAPPFRGLLDHVPFAETTVDNSLHDPAQQSRAAIRPRLVHRPRGSFRVRRVSSTAKRRGGRPAAMASAETVARLSPSRPR